MPLDNILCSASRYSKVHYTAKYEVSCLAEHFPIEWGPAYVVGVICPPCFGEGYHTCQKIWRGKTPLSPYFPADLKCIKLADLKQVETCIKLAPSIFITNNKLLIDKSEYSARIKFLGLFQENISKENEVKTWHISWIVHIIFIFFDDCFNDTKSYSVMAR